MSNETIQNETPAFHLGITMAGAASAGCYTAGAMDYLFEILHVWEDAKNGKLPDGWDENMLAHVPRHQVIIDVMGGTSAGGMTTVMAAIYALKGKINPVSDPADPTSKKNNLLYDSWVVMKDEQTGNSPKLFEKTLATTDLAADKKIRSLLNSKFIDDICDDAFRGDNASVNKPDYISDQLQVILSHTALRSVPLAVDFTTPAGKARKSHDNPEHNTFNHFITSHFKLKYDAAADAGKYLHFDPFGPGAAALKLATMATGAFPVGLRFREFFRNELSSKYVRHNAECIVNNRITDDDETNQARFKWPENFPDPFDFVAIDGGAVNNEPFGEVLSVLKHFHGTRQAGEDYKYALIMIDPFPDLVSKEKYEQPDDLFSVVPAIIGSLWDQSKLKRAEMLDAYGNDYYRGEIFPVRYNDKQKKEDYPIACGAAMAFSGLLDINFRHHDFFLGRDNARNFYRAWFTLEYNPEKKIVHPIHQSWTPEMIEYFKMPGKDGSCYLPIVPDLYFLRERMERHTRNPFKHTVAAWPQYDPTVLFSMEEKLKARVNKMVDHTAHKLKNSEPGTQHPQTARWIEYHYRENLFKRIWNTIGFAVLGLAFLINKVRIVNRVSKMAMEWILKDLETKGLLKERQS